MLIAELVGKAEDITQEQLRDLTAALEALPQRLTREEAVFRLPDIVERVGNATAGLMGREAVATSIERVLRHPEVVRLTRISRSAERRADMTHTRLYTTGRTLEMEQALRDMATGMAAQSGDALPAHAIEEKIASLMERGYPLSEEQSLAIRHATAQGGRVAVIEGAAGSVKTTTLRPIADLCRVHGGTVIATAVAWRTAVALGNDLDARPFCVDKTFLLADDRPARETIYPAATRHREEIDVYVNRAPLALDVADRRADGDCDAPVLDSEIRTYLAERWSRSKPKEAALDYMADGAWEERGVRERRDGAFRDGDLAAVHTVESRPASNDNALVRIAREVQRTSFAWRHGAAVDAFAAGREEVLDSWDELRERTRADGDAVALSDTHRETLDRHDALPKQAEPFRDRPEAFASLLAERSGILRSDPDAFEQLHDRAPAPAGRHHAAGSPREARRATEGDPAGIGTGRAVAGRAPGARAGPRASKRPKPPEGTPRGDEQSNLSDPDSRLMRKSKRHEFRQAYNTQAVVDAGGSQRLDHATAPVHFPVAIDTRLGLTQSGCPGWTGCGAEPAQHPTAARQGCQPMPELAMR